MALVLKDRVKETTTTTGTGTYTLAGAVTGFEAFSEVGDGNTTYYACTDGTDFEVGIGTYTSSGTTLARTTILQSSNSDSAVNWTSGTRTIFCTMPAEKAVFLNAEGDIQFDGTHRIKVASNGNDAVLDIAGGGPNFIRFRPDNGFSNTADGVDILYRTTPNDLLIERSENSNIIAEFGGDDGHAALYYDDAKKLETLTSGVDVTGNITVSGTVDGRDLASDGTKLDGIETGATSDQTKADIDALNIDAATLDSLDSTQFLRSDAADSFSQQIDGTTLELAGGVTYDPPGSTGSDTATDVGLALQSGARVVMGNSGFIRTIIDATASQPLQFGQSGTGYFAGTNIFGGSGSVKLHYNADGRMQTTADGINVMSSNDGGPIIELVSDDPADVGDFSTEGTIRFTAENSASESIEYASMRLRTVDVTDGTEDGSIYFSMKQGGTSADKFAMLSGSFYLLDDNGFIEFNQTKGTSFDVILDTATPTADRTITLPDATGTVLLSDGDGDVTFTGDSYNVVWDKSENTLEFGDNAIAAFGASDDLRIYHSGTHSFISEVGTGNLYISGSSSIELNKAGTSEKMLAGIADGAVELYYDNAKKLETSSTGVDVTGVITTDGMTTSADINFGDNDKAVFGAGSDLQIYHDASNSYIQDAGAGNLYIKATNLVLEANDGTNYLVGIDGTATRLHHPDATNDVKLATTSTGVDVTGELNATSIASGTTATTQSAGTNNTTIATTAFAQTAATTAAANEAIALAIALG